MNIKQNEKWISWFTPPLPKNQGYGIAAVETIRGLQRQNVRVDWNDTEPYVHINFIQPELYEGHENQWRVGYTPWESTVIPDSWKRIMETQNEIWTPSVFCKEVFESYDIQNNITVVPHGIDPQMFPIVDRTRADKFVFLHIGGPIARKGGQKVATAFVEVFGDIDDAYLVMKSHGPSEARWYDRKIYRGNVKNHPRIEVIESEMDEQQIFNLYKNAHCCVYPTNGEGFGMIPFQSIATGLPTITTDLTATKDFAHYSMPLRADWVEGVGVHLGQWAEPDMDHLKELMWQAYSNWEEEKKKAMKAARIIHSTQTWDDVAKLILNILDGKELYTVQESIDGDFNNGGGYSDWVLQRFGAKFDD